MNGTARFWQRGPFTSHPGYYAGAAGNELAASIVSRPALLVAGRRFTMGRVIGLPKSNASISCILRKKPATSTTSCASIVFASISSRVPGTCRGAPEVDEKNAAITYLIEMRYEKVCLEAIAYTLPDEIVTSAQIEESLAPLYRRLRLPEGRLELMTSIRERRFWPPGMLPSEASIASAQRALAAAGIDRRHIGALIHASVCRDHLEPATACRVHHRLGLPADCLVYDVSNACLGMLNGMLQVANMIELGQIRAGVVAGTESSRPLVETTIAALNDDETLTREQMKLAVASLTIGSASAAVVLVDRELSRTQNRLQAAAVRTNTAHHALCHSGCDESVAGGMRPLMTTDSEKLLHAGVATALETFGLFLDEWCATGRGAAQIDKTFCHQVGVAHRKLLLERLGIDPAADFSTVEFLGNTGSAAVPVTAAIGLERGHVSPGDQVALLGIGSGLNVVMIGVDWQSVPAENGSLPTEHRELWGDFAARRL